MIGGNRNMCCAIADHPQHGREYAADGRDFMTFRIFRGGHRIIVAEKLVGTVNKIDVHA